jgi:hypothetical protein
MAELEVVENRITTDQQQQFTRYFDIVLQRRKSANHRVWVFELKNCKVEYLDPKSIASFSALSTDGQLPPTEIAAVVNILSDEQLTQVGVGSNGIHKRYASKTLGQIVNHHASEQLQSYVNSLKNKPEFQQSTIIGYSVLFAGCRYLFQKHSFDM